MKIYVASLADYNAGRLHGCWIDLEGSDAETIQEQIDAMLKQSREPIAEEWRIDDHEDVPKCVVASWSVATIGEFAEVASDMDEREREAFGLFLDNEVARLRNVSDDAEDFRESYKGHHENLRDYLIDDFYECNTVPDHLTNYICTDSIVLEWGSDHRSEPANGGGVHVFGPY